MRVTSLAKELRRSTVVLAIVLMRKKSPFKGFPSIVAVNFSDKLPSANLSNICATSKVGLAKLSIV